MIRSRICVAIFRMCFEHEGQGNHHFLHRLVKFGLRRFFALTSAIKLKRNLHQCGENFQKNLGYQ